MVVYRGKVEMDRILLIRGSSRLRIDCMYQKLEMLKSFIEWYT